MNCRWFLYIHQTQLCTARVPSLVWTCIWQVKGLLPDALHDKGARCRHWLSWCGTFSIWQQPSQQRGHDQQQHFGPPRFNFFGQILLGNWLTDEEEEGKGKVIPQVKNLPVPWCKQKQAREVSEDNDPGSHAGRASKEHRGHQSSINFFHFPE